MNKDETIKETIILKDNSLETEKIVQFGNIYPLNELNFYKLKNGTSGFKDWSKRILFISIGWGIKILSVLIIFLYIFSTTTGTKDELNLEIKGWEILALIIALTSCGILYLLGGKYRNEKDNLIKQIDDFFSKK